MIIGFKGLTILELLFLSFNASKATIYECLQEDDDDSCVDNAVCNRKYNAIRLQYLPFSTFPLEEYFQQCCGSCFRLDFKNSSNLWLDLDELDANKKVHADFIYPVLGGNNLERFDNRFFFVPLMKHGGFVYVTEIKMSSFQMAIKSCLSMYPLFIICLLMSILFGFIVWIFENHRTEEDYSRCFLIGWLKGIWWSMVTMISTGPESTPKSLIGRILALIWIIVAVIMISLVSSVITAAMVQPFPTPTMNGAKVGSLRFNSYNELEILRHNGEMKTIPGSSMKEELSNLFFALRKNELHGVLVDKYTLRWFLHMDMLDKNGRHDELEGNKNQNSIKHYDFPYVLTEIKSDGSMVYGVLVDSHGKKYEYFKSFSAQTLTKNEVRLLRLSRKAISIEKNIREKIKSKTGPLVFTIDEPYIKSGVIWLTIMIGVALFIGIIYEIVRRKGLGQKSSIKAQDLQRKSLELEITKKNHPDNNISGQKTWTNQIIS